MAKVSTIIEYLGKSYNTEDILKKVKEDWISKGNKVKDLNAKIYIKIEESMIYYVVDEVTYNFSL